MSSSRDAIRDDFFANHVAANPEEGSTLGLREHGGRLSDPSAEAARAELARLRETLRALEHVAIDTIADDALRLDLDATLRAARFHARYLENDMHVTNLELAALPNGAMQHAALHARSPADHADVVARARAVPAFLDAHRRNVARGRAEGRLPSRPWLRASSSGSCRGPPRPPVRSARRASFRRTSRPPRAMHSSTSRASSKTRSCPRHRPS